MYFHLTETSLGGLCNPDIVPPRKSPILSKELLVDAYFARRMSLSQVAALTGTNTRLVRESLHANGMRQRTKAEAALGHTLPPESRKRISDSRTGQKDSEETRQRKAVILASAGGRGWNKGLTAISDERVLRQRAESVLAMSDPEFRSRSSLRMASRVVAGLHYPRGFVRGVYESEKGGSANYMSSWELRRFQELDQTTSVSSWKSQPLYIEYEWLGVVHRYVPDLLITHLDGSMSLEEIKPLSMIERALSGHPKYLKLREKLRAGESYARSHGWGWQITYFVGPRNNLGTSCTFF